MVTIRIINEFLHSPILTYDDGVITNDPEMILEDEKLQELAVEAEKMYSAYYEFDSNNESCWFNEAKEKAEKEIMLHILSQIIEKLNEINDGSYSIEDLETERLRNL